MVIEAENLGPSGAWQIRNFPTKLRLEIVERAKAERMKPGEFLTRHWLATRDEPVTKSPHAPDETHLLIEMVDRREVLRPSEAHLVHQALKHRLRLMLGLPEPPKQIEPPQPEPVKRIANVQVTPKKKARKRIANQPLKRKPRREPHVPPPA